MKRKIIYFTILIISLILLFFLSINLGSIKVSFGELFRGLFVEYNEKIAIIYDLRFPRIIIAMFAGAALSVSGVLFQAVMKNPLADPGIIGISSGASLAVLIVISFFPSAYFLSPIFTFIGGIISFILVYCLAWNKGLNPLRLILTGIAINAVFQGIIDCYEHMTSSTISSNTISMKTWGDVHLLVWYVIIALVLAFLLSGKCNLLLLEDKTVRSLGVNVYLLRIIISFVAVFLASIATAVVGVISFIALIVPHIARLIVGSDYKVLIPFSCFLGAFTLLLADTMGRLLFAPYEIPASVIMAIIGGPFLIILLRRSTTSYGN